jgi:hypothetical protein
MLIPVNARRLPAACRRTVSAADTGVVMVRILMMKADMNATNAVRPLSPLAGRGSG